LGGWKNAVAGDVMGDEEVWRTNRGGVWGEAPSIV